MLPLAQVLRIGRRPNAWLQYDLYTQDSVLLATAKEPLSRRARKRWSMSKMLVSVPENGFIRLSYVNRNRQPVWLSGLSVDYSPAETSTHLSTLARSAADSSTTDSLNTPIGKPAGSLAGELYLQSSGECGPDPGCTVCNPASSCYDPCQCETCLPELDCNICREGTGCYDACRCSAFNCIDCQSRPYDCQCNPNYCESNPCQTNPNSCECNPANCGGGGGGGGGGGYIPPLPPPDVTNKFNNQLEITQVVFCQKAREIRDRYAPFIDTDDGSAAIAMQIDLYTFLIEQTRYGAPFDIKYPGHGFSERELGNEFANYNGQRYRFDDYGNINFGLAAAILGIPVGVATCGAGIAQILHPGSPLNWSNVSGCFDEGRDTQMIRLGYTAFHGCNNIPSF